MVIKLLCCFMILFGGFMTENKNIDSLSQVFNRASNIIVTHDGNNLKLNKGDQKFQDIIDSMMTMTKDAHEMPAFGVSLDEKTREARNSGLWLELVFDKEMEYNGMPFESLLIEIHENYSGFNLIRKYNGKYDGRCFYLDLQNGNMEILDKTIRNIISNKI